MYNRVLRYKRVHNIIELMTTQEMLQALSKSRNENVARIAQNIISGKTTIEEEKKYCGDFLLSVFEGDYKDAFRRADNFNKHAFLIFLIEKGDQEKIDFLIRQQYFNYRE